MKEKIKNLVEKYRIYEPNNNQGYLKMNRCIMENKEDLAFIKAHKQDIISYLRQKKEETWREITESANKTAEWKASIGLDKLEAAINEQVEYKEAFDRAFERGDGIYPVQPENRIREMKAQYPIAAAYYKAQEWSLDANYIKANAGKDAMKRIESGDNYERVITEMETIWDKHCKNHIWD